MQSMVIKAVIFDFGGVIVPGSPSGDDPSNPYSLIEDEFGLDRGALFKAIWLENAGWLRLRVGEGSEAEWMAVARTQLTAIAGSERAEQLMLRAEALRPQGSAISGRTPEFNPGVVPLIERLRGHVRLGVLSNAAPGLEDELRDHYGIAHLFDDIINSATVHVAKPDPRIFRLAAERHGLAPAECFFIDDLPWNIEAARAEGLVAHQFEGINRLLGALRSAGVAAA